MGIGSRRDWRDTVLALLWLILGAAFSVQDAEPPVRVVPTNLLRGPRDAPRAVLDVSLRAGLSPQLRVRFLDTAGALLHELTPEAIGQRVLLPVPLPADGALGQVNVELVQDDRTTRQAVTYPAPDPGWTLHFVPGFHYDPVWWNTQAHYTETGRYMDNHVAPGLQLMDEHLDLAERDADYKVALHQLPYLRPWLESVPGATARLRSAVSKGQAGLVGGTYNEFSSTLVSAEATIRNAIYGQRFQHDVLGGAGTIFWQCDVFGHDPSFPAIMADSGHVGGAFARGPFHHWGAPRDAVNFPSEFLWMGPDGRSILSHYMAGHYGYAYQRLAAGTNRAPEDAQRQQLLVADMFADLSRVALTHHVLLPMHTDFIRPMENLGQVVRDWNTNYVSPRAVIDTSEGFFDAVAAEVRTRQLVVPTITRDMNPVYTGCQVSFADLKQANRAAEVALQEAEIFATVAALMGAPYPGAATDRAWRQLLFGAHHDGITGSMSDQVYLDVLTGYRDALQIARDVRQLAMTYLAHQIDTREIGDGLIVWNALARPRDGLVEVSTGHGEPASRFVADVPAVGYRVTRPRRLERADASLPEGVLENEFLRLSVDPEQGGALTSLIDKASGRELLAGPANVLSLLEEYPVLPGHGEGPWHLAPTGVFQPDTGFAAHLLPRDPRHPHRLVLEGVGPVFRKRLVVELPPGKRRVDFRTTILDWNGTNQLLRVEFPLDLPGARPVHQTAAAVIARPFARSVDTAVDPWTLDQACWQWAGLGTTAVLEVHEKPLGTQGTGQLVARRALGVAEIIVGARAPAERLAQANELARVLVGCGVTSTITSEALRRYGDLAFDSNTPDVRVLLGEPGEHDLLAETLAEHHLQHVPSCAWIEPERGLPSLVVPADQGTVAALMAELEQRRRITVSSFRSIVQPYANAPGRGAAVVNTGSVSTHVSAEGVVSVNLLRSNTSWPSGLWVDPPGRRLPDGAPFGTMHGSHEFRYSLVPFDGDWRAADLNTTADQVNHPLRTQSEPPHDGLLPPAASFLEIDTPGVSLVALKPAGFPEAGWTSAPAGTPDRVVARLWNGTGRRVEAGLRLAVPVGTAWLTDLLERRVAPLEIREGRVRVPLGANALETVLLEVQPAPPYPEPISLDPTLGDSSPSAYWLENLGEGITGAGVVSISPARRAVPLDGASSSVALTVFNHHAEHSATISMRLRGAPELELSLDSTAFVLAPGEERELRLVITPRGSERPQRSLVELTASVLLQPQRLGVAAGTLEGEDGSVPPPLASSRRVTAAVWVGATRPDAPPAIAIENAARLIPSGSALRATLTNRTTGPIRGVATWMLPFALWPEVPDWRQVVDVPAGASVDVVAPLGMSDDGWALLKFAYGGEIAYGETIAITGRPDRRLLAFGVDRVRLAEGRAGLVTVTVSALQGLARSSAVNLRGPPGLAITEGDRRFVRTDDGAVRLEVDFQLLAQGAPVRGELVAETGRGTPPTTARVAYTVAPQQQARPDLQDVEVDGDLAEWDDAEFTRARGEFGTMRTAVRYGSSGLALAFDVADDRFSQPNTAATIWEGDSIQFALTTAPNTSIGYSNSDLEFGAALTEGGPIVWCWYAGDGGRTGRLEGIEVMVRRQEQRTLYEMRLPRTALPGLSLEPGSVLGFSFIANDDDGEGYRGATQWTEGMVNGKDSSLFGELVLEQG